MDQGALKDYSAAIQCMDEGKELPLGRRVIPLGCIEFFGSEPNESNLAFLRLLVEGCTHPELGCICVHKEQAHCWVRGVEDSASFQNHNNILQ